MSMTKSWQVTQWLKVLPGKHDAKILNPLYHMGLDDSDNYPDLECPVRVEISQRCGIFPRRNILFSLLLKHSILGIFVTLI